MGNDQDHDIMLRHLLNRSKENGLGLNSLLAEYNNSGEHLSSRFGWDRAFETDLSKERTTTPEYITVERT